MSAVRAEISTRPFPKSHVEPILQDNEEHSYMKRPDSRICNGTYRDLPRRVEFVRSQFCRAQLIHSSACSAFAKAPTQYLSVHQ